MHLIETIVNRWVPSENRFGVAEISNKNKLTTEIQDINNFYNSDSDINF